MGETVERGRRDVQGLFRRLLQRCDLTDEQRKRLITIAEGLEKSADLGERALFVVAKRAPVGADADALAACRSDAGFLRELADVDPDPDRAS